MRFPELRPYQTKTVHLTHGAIADGHRDVCCVGPTGMGKRICAVWWAGKTVNQGKRMLMAMDRRMLVNQMADELREFGVPHGVIMGSRPQQIEYPVQVASIQTLKRREFANLPEADFLLVDEAHKDPETYRKLFALYPNALHLGLTATPVDAKGRSLEGTYYSKVVEGCKNSELIKQGFLLPTTVICPSEPDITGVSINDGEEFNQNTLAKAVRSVTTFANVFDEWAPFADRQTIVFAPGVAYARGLVEGPGDSFNARGIEAVLIESEMKPADRERAFNAFKRREIRVLLSVDILKEGSDFPIASCALDLQPNSQLRTYWQKCGRIKRIFEGQTHAVYIDMAGNLWRHYMHPDDDPDWFAISGEKTTRELTISKRNDSNSDDPKEPKLIVCPKCGESRKGGPKCPNCGHEYDKQVKHIRMGDGKLKEVSAEYVAKREKTEQEKLASKWKSELFIGRQQGRTLAQCANQFERRHGVKLPKGIPCVPVFGSAHWRRQVGEVFSERDVAVQFSKWESHVKESV
jgi:DNA repair protein RadD